MKRWMLSCIVVLVAFESLIRKAHADDDPLTTADLKITFYYDSDTNPDPVPIDMGKDTWCSSGPTRYYENLIVDSKTYGIKNVVVYPARDSNLTLADVDEESLKKAQEPVVLKSEKCVFTPHVISAVVGGTIETKNLDATGHSVHFNFLAGAGFAGALIPGGAVRKVDVKVAERSPTPIECDVHPWMRAYAIATETPFVGISDENGELVIKKLPTNRPIKLKLWHEHSQGAIEKVDLDGKIVTWKKGIIDLNLKPGMNDLGVCKLTPEHFKD